MSKLRADRTVADTPPPGAVRSRRPRRRRHVIIVAAVMVVATPITLFGINVYRALWGDARQQSIAATWNVTAVDSAAIAASPALEAIATHWVARMNELYSGLIVRHWATPGGDLVVVLNPGFYRLLSSAEQLGAIEDLTEHWRYMLANAASPWPTAHGFVPGLVVVSLRKTGAGANAILDVRADVRDGRAMLYSAPETESHP